MLNVKQDFEKYWLAIKTKFYYLVKPSECIEGDEQAFRATMLSSLLLLYAFLTSSSFLWSSYSMPEVTARVENNFYIAIFMMGVFYILSRTRFSPYVAWTWILFMISMLAFSASAVLRETQAVQMLVHIGNAIFISSFIFSTLSTIFVSIICISILAFSPDIYPVISEEAGDSLMRFMFFISALSVLSVHLRNHFFKLSRQKALADATNESKNLFLASMSHEIRTPLTAIIGFSEVVKEQNDIPTPTRLYLDRIYENSKYLLQLISNVIELSRLEAKQIIVENCKSNVANEVTSSVDSFFRKASDKGLEIRLNIDPSVPKQVITDPVKTRQILNNLLDNAIKFTEKGVITLNVNTINDPIKKQRNMVYEVVDQGCGIEPKDLQKIFEFFHRGGSLKSKMQIGAGIGLALSQKIAQAMGGELRIKSTQPGEGCVFQFVVPIKEYKAEVYQLYEANNSIEDVNRSPNILLADDSENSRMLFEVVFGQTDMNLTLVEDGQQAVNKVVESGKFDLIVMDLQMPNMDGYEAVEKIREMGVNTPIIALTAHALSQYRDRCMKSGFTDYVTKPIIPSKFIKKVRSYL